MSLIPIAPFTKATASQGSQTNDFSCIIAASANETGYGAPGAAYDKRRSNREFVRSTSEDRNCYTPKSTQKRINERKFMFALKKKYWVLGSILLLASIPFAAKAVRTDVSRDFPVYSNHGKPDLTVDPKRFVSQMEIVDRFFDTSSCEIAEGSVGGTGYRRLLRFDTVLINGGDGDLVVGSPTDPNNPYHSVFIYSACHMHYHISGFSDYKLLNLDRTIAAVGHKQAFCLEDLLKYTNDNKSSGYVCAFQGITTGWADWYFKQLSGQWIDITGVPAGDYIVHVEINAAHTFDEGANRYPNVIETTIHVPDPRNKVTVDNSPAATD